LHKAGEGSTNTCPLLGLEAMGCNSSQDHTIDVVGHRIQSGGATTKCRQPAACIDSRSNREHTQSEHGPRSCPGMIRDPSPQGCESVRCLGWAAANLRARQQKEDLLNRVKEHYAFKCLPLPACMDGASYYQLLKHWETVCRGLES